MLQDKRILLTGGAGFIGTTVARLLCDDNDVVLFDNFHNDAFANTDLAEHPRVTMVEGDILDVDALRAAADGVTHVIHLAAIAGVATVLKSPVRTMRVNLLGTANVAQVAHERGDALERFVDFSTSEVLGRHASSTRTSRSSAFPSRSSAPSTSTGRTRSASARSTTSSGARSPARS